jgi:3-hydroxyisobutyrate dehydrogenase
MKKIGFIGLGNMGSKMCVHLVKGGHTVSGFDINKKLIDELVDKGIKREDSISDISKNKDIIITMLPNGSIVDEVLKEVISQTLNTPTIIDCSTIDVNTSKKMYELALLKNISLLDAPVSGGTMGANNGTLTFMVGGNETTFDEMSPLFNLMGSKALFCGDAGAGQATKLCNNMLLATTMIGVGESFNMAKKLNLDLNILYEVISTATGSCWAVNNYCPVNNVGPQSPADNDFLPGFSAKLMSKDLKLAVNAAEESSSNIIFGRKSEELFTKMAQGMNGEKDFSAIIKEIE